MGHRQCYEGRLPLSLTPTDPYLSNRSHQKRNSVSAPHTHAGIEIKLFTTKWSKLLRTQSSFSTLLISDTENQVLVQMCIQTTSNFKVKVRTKNICISGLIPI